MNERAAIEKAVRSAFGGRETVKAVEGLCGGCIHHVSRIELGSGGTIVVKAGTAAGALFREEMRGLEALHATGAVLVPEPISVSDVDGTAVLLMSDIRPAKVTERAWERLGDDLAALHAAEAGRRYGFDGDNHLGTTPQPNGWMDDWVEFNRERRLGHQVKLASARGLLEPREQREIQHFIDRLDQFIPRCPKPALLHGDLWSGNALPTIDERIAIIDPAVHVGDGWADIAMMRLFGGFSEATFGAYEQQVADREQVQERVAVYQLYHLLNHINIFGRGFASQAMTVVGNLLYGRC